jgi:hypothetical protein
VRLKEKLDELVALVESARGLPVSSSVIVNKAELVRLLDELRELLPEDLVEAQTVLDRRDQILTEAVSNAERLLTAAAEEQRRLVSETEVVQEARVEAGALIQAARGQAEQMARDIDKYVDAKLAHLEVSITKLLDTVRQGRERLAQPELYAELAALQEPTGELDAAAASELEAAITAGDEREPDAAEAPAEPDEPAPPGEAASAQPDDEPLVEDREPRAQDEDSQAEDTESPTEDAESPTEDAESPTEDAESPAEDAEGAAPEGEPSGGADGGEEAPVDVADLAETAQRSRGR